MFICKAGKGISFYDPHMIPHALEDQGTNPFLLEDLLGVEDPGHRYYLSLVSVHCLDHPLVWDYGISFFWVVGNLLVALYSL